MRMTDANVVCLGVSHRTAPLEVRERFAVSPGRLESALCQLAEVDGVEEAVIVSTCNRVEFYASGPSLRAESAGLTEFLRRHSGLPCDDPAVCYRYDFPRSVEHLFRVGCGMESMVTGETEILGQVKQAYRVASDRRFTGTLLNKLFQRAFHVAKQVRTKTGINRGAVSVGSVAVELAGKIFGDLSACRVMIVGAGENSERTARSLMSRGVSRILVANRSAERANALADTMRGRAVPLEKWEDEIGGVDILIASTAAPHQIIDRAKLAPHMRGRSDRPLFIIDIAVPRDVAPDANEIENVYLFDIDSLQALAEQSIRERRLKVSEGEGMVREHVEAFSDWMSRHGLRGVGRREHLEYEGGGVVSPKLGR